MSITLCSRLGAIIALLTALSPTREASGQSDSELPAATSYVIREYTTGISYPVISSSYDHQPQIEVLPDAPAQRIVPIQRTPWIGEDEENDRNVPPPGKQVKKFGGFQGTSQAGWIPPDPSLAVGPNHIVSTTNQQIAWFTKDGTMQFSQPLGSPGNPGFLEDVGAGNFTFDPKCLYDELEGRFLVLALEVYTSTAYITFAVSDDSDPNGIWYKYRTDAKTSIGGSDYWVDYPGLGFDDEAYYVTGNLFGMSSGWGGVKYRIFDKTPVLSGAPVVYADLRDGNSASVQVAHMHSTPVAPFFVSVKDSNEIRIQAITSPTTAPTLHTTDVVVPGFAQPPGAPNLGGSTISTVDHRIMTADFRNQFLLAGHAISADGRAQARWYEFWPGTWPNSGSVTMVQNGNIDLGAGIYTFFPAIARNAAGNTAICFARSSSSEYASIWYTHRETSDASGTMRTARELKGGEGSYSSGRWGDYFDIAVDPTNNTTFWGIGEYASAGGAWRTWIGVLGIVDGQVTQIGAGSPGSGGYVPIINAGTPAIGEALQVTTSLSIGGVPYYHAMSFFPGSFTLKGAAIHVGLPWFLAGPYTMGNVGFPGFGFHVANYTIPANPNLIGGSIYLQSLILDPGAPLGLAATPGVQLTIGE
ncbi:MAG: hypothetical protein V2A76_14395 [Planctomycetota bacterium]